MSSVEEAANLTICRGTLAITEGNLASAASLWLSFGKTMGQMREGQESGSQAVS